MSPLCKAIVYLVLGMLSLVVSANATLQVRAPFVSGKAQSAHSNSFAVFNGFLNKHLKLDVSTNPDSQTGGSFDGIDPSKINLDQIWYQRWQDIKLLMDQRGQSQCEDNDVSSQIQNLSSSAPSIPPVRLLSHVNSSSRRFRDV